MDYLSAAPILPEAYEGMLPYLSESHGNPQSLHAWGKEAHEAVETARREVAFLIGANPGEIYFTSSGSESNNWVVKGVSSFFRKKGNHMITSIIEHVSLTNPLRTLMPQGFAVTFLPVDASGRINPHDIEKNITPQTLLLTLHHAQTEIGTIQSVKELGELARKSNLLFHLDGVAAAGLIPVDVKTLGADFYTLSAQSVYGPKGIAALYIKKGRRLDRLIEGGNQEDGRRAGLENVPGIVGFGIAARHAREHLAERRASLRAKRDRLIEGILSAVAGCHLTGDPVHRLPHHASFYFEGIEGEALVLLLAREGLAAATGSSCVSGAIKPPSVLSALGISASQARGSLVLTPGWKTTDAEIREAVLLIASSIKKLRNLNP
ncbi:MAG: cysteine desulfurase family protein [Nitrospiria bacterium]